MNATLDDVTKKKAKAEPSAQEQVAEELVRRAREQGHASCIDGVRGSMSVRTTASSCSASSTPAVAAARRSIPVGLTRLERPGPRLRKS
jgi:hypothetical protein